MLSLLRNLRSRIFRSRTNRLIHDEQGATAVEYAVMLALILLTCLASIVAVGNATSSSLSNTNTRLNNVGFGS